MVYEIQSRVQSAHLPHPSLPITHSRGVLWHKEVAFALPDVRRLVYKVALERAAVFARDGGLAPPACIRDGLAHNWIVVQVVLWGWMWHTGLLALVDGDMGVHVGLDVVVEMGHSSQCHQVYVVTYVL